jgi:sugar phosphate isomerase/epimerase
VQNPGKDPLRKNRRWLRSRSIPLPNVAFCWDNGHENCYTPDFEFMPLFHKRLVCTHLHDNDGGRGYDQHWLPFDGTCDFRRVMSKLDQYGYTGTLMLEVSQKKKPEYLEMTPQDFLKTAFDRIQTIAGYSTL